MSKPEFLDEIKNSEHNFNINLGRITEKLNAAETTADASTDLQGELAATEQCLRICEDVQASEFLVGGDSASKVYRIGKQLSMMAAIRFWLPISTRHGPRTGLHS